MNRILTAEDFGKTEPEFREWIASGRFAAAAFEALKRGAANARDRATNPATTGKDEGK